MVEPVISVDKLRVIYNQGKSNEMRALEETNLKIFPKEYIIIYGPSGCGKSTLLYSISGLQRATYGNVTVQDISLSQMNEKQELELHQTKIGMIFQAFYLIPSLTIIDNVCLPKIFRGESPSSRRAEGMRLLRRFGIAEQADKFPNQLSGGQKQRVAIARSLINNPEIILADEPVGNLDSESAQNVLTLLKELNDVDKKTIIMVTHNPEHLVYADRVLHMKDGMVVSEEIHEEKRPIEVAQEEIKSDPVEVPNELKMLMHSFKNLSSQQMNILLIPFKAKQLLNHTLSELREEQVNMAESLLKELLFNNIDASQLTERLDADLDNGGAGWNKQRATSFSERIRNIMQQSKNIQESPEAALPGLATYLIDLLHLHINPEQALRLQTFLKQRVESKINQFELKHKLDAPKILGGVGLHKGTAEKLVRELEMIMLLKY
ncbi:MAG: ABC transporter ATP-binding protein [Candidatus Moranbacteria bacterium]|nr:ABC transporter ATP-binding protein [Candidatus Moranbacteria bacterium]